LRVAAELLWARAARLQPWQVDDVIEHGLTRDAFDEVMRRAGIEFDRSGLSRRRI
jgi:hypothetical protein